MAGRSRNGGFYNQVSGQSVVLNVYDLVPYNAYSYYCGVGVFHAGVEVYGVEYAYGGAHALGAGG
jgi:hypothetical protein